MYRTEFCTLWEKARVGCFERTALKHVYYQEDMTFELSSQRQVEAENVLLQAGGNRTQLKKKKDSMLRKCSLPL